MNEEKGVQGVRGVQGGSFNEPDDRSWPADTI